MSSNHRRQQLKPTGSQSLCQCLVFIVAIIPLLRLIDISSSDLTATAFNTPNYQRRTRDLTSPITFKSRSASGTGKIQRGCSILLQRKSNSSMELYLMNWFGFGSNNNNNDGENGGGRSNDSTVSSDASSTMLLSSSSKDFTGKSPNSSSRTGGSTSGVVTIMDTMDQLKRSQRIGKITATLVQELKSISVEGSSENGKIKIIFDGQQNPISTYIDESYFREARNNGDANDLAKSITAAMKDARMKSVEKMNEKMKNVYNDLGFYNTPQ